LNELLKPFFRFAKSKKKEWKGRFYCAKRSQRHDKDMSFTIKKRGKKKQPKG
jgi:hypothetical protein